MQECNLSAPSSMDCGCIPSRSGLNLGRDALCKPWSKAKNSPYLSGRQAAIIPFSRDSKPTRANALFPAKRIEPQRQLPLSQLSPGSGE